MSEIVDVLIKPHITEKTAKQGEKQGKYVFVVQRSANKLQIKDAIEKMYSVKVESVNTVTLPAKRKSRFTKSGFLTGKTKVIKKATITLAEGDEIDYYGDV